MIATVTDIDARAKDFAGLLVSGADVRHVDGDAVTLGDLLTNLDAELLVIPPSRAKELVVEAPCIVAVLPPAARLPTELDTIGLAWDGTPAAAHALRWAVALAQRTHAGLRLLHVLRPAEDESEAIEALGRVRDHLTDGCRCDVQTAHGDPVTALAALAADVDVLVLGCGHPDHGSVAADVATRSAAAVTVVPFDADVPPPANASPRS
jgi:nucleotide-binding universal stress UspA family protein